MSVGGPDKPGHDGVWLDGKEKTVPGCPAPEEREGRGPWRLCFEHRFRIEHPYADFLSEIIPRAPLELPVARSDFQFRKLRELYAGFHAWSRPRPSDGADVEHAQAHTERGCRSARTRAERTVWFPTSEPLALQLKRGPRPGYGTRTEISERLEANAKALVVATPERTSARLP
jgi:hypothetical protein